MTSGRADGHKAEWWRCVVDRHRDICLPELIRGGVQFQFEVVVGGGGLIVVDVCKCLRCSPVQ